MRKRVKRRRRKFEVNKLPRSRQTRTEGGNNERRQADCAEWRELHAHPSPTVLIRSKWVALGRQDQSNNSVKLAR